MNISQVCMQVKKIVSDIFDEQSLYNTVKPVM